MFASLKEILRQRGDSDQMSDYSGDKSDYEKDVEELKEKDFDFVDDDIKNALVGIDDDLYKRIGFYYAVKNNEKPKEKVDSVIKKIEEKNKEKIKGYFDVYEKNISNIDFHINKSREKIEECKKDLNEHQGEVEALKKEQHEVLGEIKEIKKEMYLLYEDAAKEKDKILKERVNGRLLEFKNEMSSLIDAYRELDEKRYKTSQAFYEKNKIANEKKIKRFTALKEEVEELSGKVNEKIKVLNESGITEHFTGFLIVVGMASVFAAGWFFSVFTASREMISEDILSFLMKRILSFGMVSFKQGDTAFEVLLALIGVWLGILVLVGVVAWFSHEIIKRHDGYNYRANFRININEDGGLATADIRSRSPFMLWIGLLPFIFVAGIGFILISMFDSNDGDLDVLFKSLSGQMIGTLIAFVATGVVMLYITFVIDERLNKFQYKEGRRFSALMNNWELSFIVVVFVLGVITLIVYSFISGDIKSFVYVDPLISLASFLFMVLFIGFTLGYGIRYRGIYKEKERLDERLKNISLAIEQSSRPKMLDLHTVDSPDFRKKYHKCCSDVLDLPAVQNRMIKQSLSDSENRKLHGFFKWPYKTNFEKHSTDKEYSDSAFYDLFFENFLPHYKIKIDDIHEMLDQKNKDLNQINKDIRDIKNHDSLLWQKIISDIEKNESRIREYMRNKVRVKEEYERYKQAAFLTLQKNISELKEGFDLGVWYMKKNFE